MEEAGKWMKRARRDLKVAKDNLSLRNYEYAAFLCQQAAEKALKAVALKQKGELRKIHDLVALGRDAGLPGPLLEHCKELTLAYTFSRYPDVEGSHNLRESASHFLKHAKEVLAWAERKL